MSSQFEPRYAESVTNFLIYLPCVLGNLLAPSESEKTESSYATIIEFIGVRR